MKAAIASKHTDESVAVFMRHIDGARAVFKGLVVVGHRCSAAIGEMFWALPGGDRTDSVSLASRDPAFAVIKQPTREQLLEAQTRLTEGTVQ